MGEFNTKVGRENVFIPTTGNESLHQDSNHIGVRMANLALTSTIFPLTEMFTNLYFAKGSTWNRSYYF